MINLDIFFILKLLFTLTLACVFYVNIKYRSSVLKYTRSSKAQNLDLILVSLGIILGLSSFILFKNYFYSTLEGVVISLQVFTVTSGIPLLIRFYIIKSKKDN